MDQSKHKLKEGTLQRGFFVDLSNNIFHLVVTEWSKSTVVNLIYSSNFYKNLQCFGSVSISVDSPLDDTLTQVPLRFS